MAAPTPKAAPATPTLKAPTSWTKWAGTTTTATAKLSPWGMKLPNELGIYDMSGNVWGVVRGPVAR
ncbi:MAG: SUMF1/EgtB/PvdO family nonheme iron enzyme [Lewinellaceae bacterium]|nr:SUMF1/EgtB/PvdO family nonheme iron enzyme [Lewinellaceae bacterium]